MFRKLAITSAFLLLALPMFACMTVNTTVNEDGSGLWEFGLNMSVLETMGASETDLTGSLGAEEGEATEIDPETGLTISTEIRTTEDDQKWFYMIALVPSIEGWDKLGSYLAETTSESTEGAGTEMMPLDMSGTDTGSLIPKVTITDGVLRVEFSSEATTEEGAATPEPQPTMDPMTLSMMQMMGLGDMSITYNITVPGTITDTTGEIDEETNTVTYTIDLMTSPELPTEMYVESSLQ